ncbi:hypothetical protein HJD18_09740 [Thermoleophilia bacterium SCSIO 60948]|nr:hypothetical protein HJD18_09740 [Thermoleophilia bacterium SCSIO 60948]
MSPADDAADADIQRYAWNNNQRLPFLILGILLAVTQAINGQFAFAAVFLFAFVAIYFTYGQTQTRLDPDGITWRGSFGRKQASWDRVGAIEPGKALGIRQMRITVDGSTPRTLPAPIDGLMFRDREFDAKSERIRAYAAAHGAPLGVDSEAREKL